MTRNTTPPIHVFSGSSLDELYITAVRAVFESGEEIVKNGRRIKEIYPAVFVLEDPYAGILCVENRPYNPAFLVAETLWNLTGETSDWLVRYNRKYSPFFSDGKLLSGYGYRLFNWKDGSGNELNQIELIIQRLIEEPISQHASATIFDPRHDLGNPPFVPCIVRLQFKIRDGRLFMSSYLRAQDIWIGFPYDVHLLLSLFHLVAYRLNLPLGSYYHYCDVLRLYEANYEAAAAPLLPAKGARSRLIDFTELGSEWPEKLDLYRHILQSAPQVDRAIIDRQPIYWRDSLNICCAYQAANRGELSLASGFLAGVENILLDQFWIWAAHFSPKLLSLRRE